MINKKHLLALLPVVLGLTAAGLLNLTRMPNPVLYLRADLGTLLFGTSLFVSGGLIIGQLITARTSQLVEEIKENNAAERRRFLRLLDHELKNPLTAMMAGLANLENENPEEQHQPALTSMETQLQRLNQLVTDLRKLSELETRPIEKHPVAIPALLEEVYQLGRSRIGRDRVMNLLIPQAPWPIPDVLGDRDLLFLAIHNLIDNAIKFTEIGDTIEIRASEDGRNVLVEIADSGPGIPGEELNLVWDELFRGRSARGIPGSGIGLALVQGIIRRHQGSVSLRSREGEGTIVSLSLPLSQLQH